MIDDVNLSFYWTKVYQIYRNFALFLNFDEECSSLSFVKYRYLVLALDYL